MINTLIILFLFSILTFRDLKDYVDTFENDLRGSEDFKKLYHYAYDMLNVINNLLINKI